MEINRGDILISKDHPIWEGIEKACEAYGITASEFVLNVITAYFIEIRARGQVWPVGQGPLAGEWRFCKTDQGRVLLGLDLAAVVEPFLVERYREIDSWHKAYLKSQPKEQKKAEGIADGVSRKTL